MIIQPSLRLELDIPAQRLVSQYVTNNKNIEEQVKKELRVLWIIYAEMTIWHH